MKATAKLPIMLKDLKLPTFSKNWQELAQDATNNSWGYEDYLAVLSELEVQEKYRRRVARFLKMSGLNSSKGLSSFNFSLNKSIKKAQICSLANSTSWVSDANNLILIGPSGVGKTHLAMAIGNNLLEQGLKVLFKTGLSLAQELQAAKKNLELTKLLDKYNSYPVLIIDDLGYVKKDEMETSVLFELISERYEYKSLILTSNQPFSEWDNIFTDTAMTVAAIDRLVHHATIINITGESFRKRESARRCKKGYS